jgi:hypothetical protein
MQLCNSLGNCAIPWAIMQFFLKKINKGDADNSDMMLKIGMTLRPLLLLVRRHLSAIVCTIYLIIKSTSDGLTSVTRRPHHIGWNVEGRDAALLYST